MNLAQLLIDTELRNNKGDTLENRKYDRDVKAANRKRSALAGNAQKAD